MKRESVTSSQKVSYKKYQLIKVKPIDDDAVLEIESVAEEPGVQVWTPIRINQTVDLILPPSAAASVKRFLSQREIDYEVVSNDLEVYT